MSAPIADTFSRTALIRVHDSTQPTLDLALAAHAATGIAIAADADSTRDASGQAALSAAIAAAVRAVGVVAVVADRDTVLSAGPYRGGRVIDMINAEGAAHVKDLTGVPADHPVILIGATELPAAPAAVVLRATWTGWTAHVRPARPVNAAGRGGGVLAAIAAGALAVHEAFGAIRGLAGSDAGYRSLDLNLWQPGDELDEAPAATHAPAAWWLVGLGHLGQANAWVLSWLTYEEPGRIEIVLQDTDTAVAANHSTAVLTPRRPGGIRKTRLAAAVLDRLGFDTVLFERRLDATTRTATPDTHVALVGVDNLATRRLISNVGWPLALDVGLGAGPADFNAILLRRFPAENPSQTIAGWADPATPPRPRSATPGIADLARRDPCGSVQLAGTAAGAAFVGITAACLAVAQSIRATIREDGYDVINLHLQSNDASCAGATQPVEPCPAPLAFPH